MNPDDQERERLQEVFFAYARRRENTAKNSNQRFVYYTTADTALKIVERGELWMRSATVMNDFSEILHGRECLIGALREGGRKALSDALAPILPDFLEQVLEGLDSHSILHHKQTYLVCFSEHLPEEDAYGRLSMWRAYGGANGVALVFYGRALLSQSNALKIYSSPVAYLDAQGMRNEIVSLAQRISAERELLLKYSDVAMGLLSNALRFAVLSTKHPAFKEEREWRVIYQPWTEISPHVSHAVETVRGLPQIVQKIPLRDIPDEGFHGANIVEGLDRVIVGPTQFPDSLLSSFSEALAKRGVREPHHRVHISNVPLRFSN
ncbi:MAG: DUF2971 domain-containing protein [Steroidobacteraceae bacterium]